MSNPECSKIFDEWNPLIQKYKNIPNVELEIRLGRKSKTMFDTNVGSDSFQNILRSLMKYPHWETSRHSKSTIYYFKNSRRLSVDEESDEQDGCEKRRLCAQDFKIENSKYDVRLGISTEEPWDYDGEEVSTEQKDKERWSFVRKNLSIDMTVIKGAPDDKDSDTDTFYQVELEIINPKNLKNDIEVYNILYKIFNILECV